MTEIMNSLRVLQATWVDALWRDATTLLRGQLEIDSLAKHRAEWRLTMTQALRELGAVISAEDWSGSVAPGGRTP